MSEKSANGFRESDYYAVGLSEERYKRKELNTTACCCLLCCMFTVIITLLIVTLSIRYTGPQASLYYNVSLGSSQLIKFEDFFCDRVTMTANSETTELNGVSMYLLNEEPPLDRMITLTISGDFQVKNYDEDLYGWYDYGYIYDYVVNYVTWQFYLYQGSVIQLQACVESGEGTLIIIQGNNNYRFWRYDPYDTNDYSVQLEACATTGSGGGIDFSAIEYSISVEDEYFIAFFATSGDPSINLQYLTVQRVEYSVAGYTNLPNCSISQSQTPSCSLDISLNSYKYALIETLPESTTSLSMIIIANLMWECNARNWSYVLMFFVPSLMFTVLFGACYCVFYCWNKKNKTRYQVMRESDESATNRPPAAVLQYDRRESEAPPPYSAGVV